MSAVVELAPSNVRHHAIMEAMAYPFRSYQGPHAPYGQAYYAPENKQMHRPQQQQWVLPQQPRPIPQRLPPMSTLVHATPQSSLLPQPHGHDPFRKPTNSRDYATPSPMSQGSPQFPRHYSELSPPSRQPNAESRMSPSHLSLAATSDRSFNKTQDMHSRAFHQEPVRLMEPLGPQGSTGLMRPLGPAIPWGPMGSMSLMSPAHANQAYASQRDPAMSSYLPAQPYTPHALSTAPSYGQFAAAQATPPTSASSSPRTESRRISIAEIMNGEVPISRSMVPTSPATTVGDMRPPPRYSYRLNMEQEPVAARSCGFGERDRRVIDPPPILGLRVFEKDYSRLVDGKPTERALSYEEMEKLDTTLAVVHCSIWDESGERDMSKMEREYNSQRRLMGTVASGVFLSHKPDGLYFPFSDLSCRTVGRYRLRFSLVRLKMDSGSGRPMRLSFPIECVAWSKPFQVYNAKDFPGMQASTPLARRLKDQGCLIAIKKGITGGSGKGRRRSRSDHSEEEDSLDDAEDEEEDGNSRKKTKRSG